MDGCSEVLHLSSPVPGEDDVVLHYRTTDEPRYSVEVVVLHVVDPWCIHQGSPQHTTPNEYRLCLSSPVGTTVPLNNRMIGSSAEGTGSPKYSYVHPSTHMYRVSIRVLT